MTCVVVNSQAQVQSRLPSLPQTLPQTQADWNSFLATLQQWAAILQQESHAPNVIPSQFQTFSSTSATAVIAALTASNCTVSIDTTDKYYGTASLSVTGLTNPATLQFSGTPIAIAPASRWFCSFQILALSGCTGSLTVTTSAGNSVTEGFTIQAGSSWQQVWGLFDLRKFADTRATWKFTFTSTAVFALDGMQMNSVGSPIGTLPKFAGTQMVTGSLAYQSNLDGVPDGSARFAVGTKGNILNTTIWKIGTTGSQGNFVDNANTANTLPSAIFLGGNGGTPIGPYPGHTEPLWIGYGAATSGADGGWNNTNDLIGIDSTKSYRVSAWTYITSRFNGNLYLGCDVNYTNNVGGGQNTNPYFLGNTLGALGITTGKWYLLVGILHGSGYTGSQSGISGIYDPSTGQQVFVGTDFQCAVGAPHQTHRAYIYYDTGGTDHGSADYAAFARPRFEIIDGTEPTIQSMLANSIDGMADGILYRRFLSTYMDGSRRVSTVAGGNSPLGAIAAGSVNLSFTYTSTTTSIRWSWAAGTVYRMDGTTTTINSGSLTVSGLSASTTYYFAPYYDEVAGAIKFVSGGTGVGSPASAYASQDPVAGGQMNMQSHAPLGWMSAVTPASGSGGGGGPPVCCLNGEQPVELPDGEYVHAAELVAGMRLTCPEGETQIVKACTEPWNRWVAITLSNDVGLLVAPDHRFVDPAGVEIRASELRLEQILQARSGYAYVTQLERLERPGIKVSLEVCAPHTYYVQGILSHNKFMCP